MKKYLLCFLFCCSALTAGIPVSGDYLGPTFQLIEREGKARIEKKLRKNGISKDLEVFFDSIGATEDWGHIGYHGANQGYRVYQDIIRFTIEEILDIPIRDDFHFFRVPGDTALNLNSVSEFVKYWGKDKVDTKSDTRAKQLLSLNFGIYSNYDEGGSCSIYLFAKDKSKHSVNYSKQLAPFFKKLGINTNALIDLFEIARIYLDKEGGILLQLSENSHLYDDNFEAYNFLDTQGYPSRKAGRRWGSLLLSNHFECLMTDYYVNSQVNIAPQFRLLMNNRYTLNPFSHLSVRRYDLYDPEIILDYEKALREYIRNINFDAEKVSRYRQELLDIWQADDQLF